MPREFTTHRAVHLGRQVAQRVKPPYNAPTEPEYRGPAEHSPLPPGTLEGQFAEMFANDPEAQEWRSLELSAEWPAKR
jgi:hypothetical protein